MASVKSNKVADLKIQLRKLIKNYSKTGSDHQLTTQEFQQLVKDLFGSLGTEQQLTQKQLGSITTTFDSSQDGYVQIDQLQSVIKQHGISQKKKKVQLAAKKAAMESESSMFSDMF